MTGGRKRITYRQSSAVGADRYRQFRWGRRLPPLRAAEMRPHPAALFFSGLRDNRTRDGNGMRFFRSGASPLATTRLGCGNGGRCSRGTVRPVSSTKTRQTWAIPGEEADGLKRPTTTECSALRQWLPFFLQPTAGGRGGLCSLLFPLQYALRRKGYSDEPREDDKDDC